MSILSIDIKIKKTTPTGKKYSKILKANQTIELSLNEIAKITL